MNHLRPQAMEPRRLFDFVDHQLSHFPLEESLSDLYAGQTTSYSTRKVYEWSNQIAHGLLANGLQPGDRIGLVTFRNRSAFTILDLGIQKAGMVSVPLYPTISAREYAYILNDAACKVVFFGGEDLGEKLQAVQPQVPSLLELYSIDNQAGFTSWETIWSEQSSAPIGKEIDPSTLVTIIYTSGTTGFPKGVMLNHTNVVENVKSVHAIIPLDPGERVMSFLPLSHIFERTASFSYLYHGAHVTFTALDNLGGEEGDLQRVKPHFMTCVPRLLEKIYEKIYQKGLSLSGPKRMIFFWAMSLTEDYAYDKTYRGYCKMAALACR